MAPLVLEGDTLGQKHQSYNKILKETKQELLPEINYEESDLDNLLKIDIACKNRNVDYILKVLQSEDMLYVSRAIKRSIWLITDQQYANIINPKYLHDELAPNMTVKAFNKLILQIRLNLKNEKRVEEFFNYYKDRNLQVAFKWLQFCSIEFTNNIIRLHSNDIPRDLFKRLCEKSVTFLETFIRHNTSYYRAVVLSSTTFLLNNNTEKYLDIIEAYNYRDIPKFGPKPTQLIMKKCGDRIMKNLDNYCEYLHAPTFAKFVKQEEMKDFILKYIKNKKMRSWFSHNKIKPFLNRLPLENRFEFIKEIFIDRKQEDVDDEIVMYCRRRRRRRGRRYESTSQNIYCWYTYAPFNTAFVDLKKLIRSESNPTERTSMFGVLITCAGKDMKNIKTLLKYYREKHINEPFKFKIQFVNLVLSHTNTHRFDEETWGYLNDLFSSMDVYSESDKLVQSCVMSIILYNVIHDENVPDIIEKKFLFDTYKTKQNKLTGEEKEKLFSYLYKYVTSKLKKVNLNTETGFSGTVNQLRFAFNLLLDWDKELKDYPLILEKTKEIIQIKKKKMWKDDISDLYNVKKSWRKLLFEESLLLSRTQETCINALKHGPKLLEEYQNEVQSICFNERALISQFLKKIRIYWSQSLANSYKVTFMNNIDEKNKHKALIVGLCTLLPKNDVLNLVEKYVPNEAKIDWSQPDDLNLSLCKHVAMNMHIARPQPSPTAVLLYAKGDYLQYVIPSLSAILCNASSTVIRENLKTLLDSPVSLQKHGIRAAFAKLKHDELKNLFAGIWKTNKNSSIRADIFNQTLNFLCNAKDETVIREMWELLKIFIDNLTSEENKSIYTKLSKVEKVPMSVRAEFWMRSYKFLKSMPAKANCDGLLTHLARYMTDVMEFIDNEFAAEMFLESFDEKFGTERYDYVNLVTEFLLSTKTEDAHIERYNKILVPILKRSFAMWDKVHDGKSYVKYNLQRLFTDIDREFQNIVLSRKMFVPIPMYTNILESLRENLPLIENYVLITGRMLALDFIKILYKSLKANEELSSEMESKEVVDDANKWIPLYAEAAPQIGKACVEFLKKDVANHFSSIYELFAEVFDDILVNYEFNAFNRMKALESFLECNNFIPGILLVLSMLPIYIYDDDEKTLKKDLFNRISGHYSKEVKMHYWVSRNKM